MNESKKPKLFISYSHLDEEQINQFIKHLAPLKNNGLIDEWYDRKIIAGQDLQKNIDNNLEDADIICLFISVDFLSSKACLREKADAIKLKKKKVITIIPIILAPCGWLDDKDLSPLLALPTDGKAISSFKDSNVAWNNVYDELKKVIEKENAIIQLKISGQFLSFLQSTELLSKAHSQKEEVLLDDIFVYPELARYDDLREYEKTESSEKLIDDFFNYSKALIAGEDQSGKTTLCKKLFIDLRQKSFVPIYISDKKNYYLGSIENKISKAFKEQYHESILLERIEKDRIVPIIDDFHFAKHKEKLVQALASYRNQIVIVDDIFGLNFRDENLIKSINHFKIQEFIPSLRNKLIKKWVLLTDNKSEVLQSDNTIYQNIDYKTEFVDTALGKIIGSGIMPAYPFFIVSVMSTYETFNKPLDQEITSQGYCYQALIYMYLRKQGVKNDEIDTYINFLSELAFYIHKEKKSELPVDDFKIFISSYTKKYNLPIKLDTLLKNLQKTNIFSLDSFNNYSFCYSYIYFFFVGKYLAEHLDNNKEIIDNLINNLHKNDNAYIAIFISHHSKNVYILDEIIVNALTLFEKYTPATLSDDELSFFDEKEDLIIKAVLPQSNNTAENEREKDLKEQDHIEQLNNKTELSIEESEEDDAYFREMRRSIKTVEVMGRIIKNRAGSLGKEKLESVFEEGMKIHLRILKSFIDLIKNEKSQQNIVDYISSRLNLIIEKEGITPSKDKLVKMSKSIFWNINFSIIYNFIDKIIRSLGSDKLTSIIEKVCDKENTPASFMVKQGILMWYNKNMQIDNIANRIDSDGFSKTARNIMKHKVVNHCRIHSVGFKEKQKIEYKLKIPSTMLITREK